MTSLYPHVHTVEMSVMGNSKHSHGAEQSPQDNWTASGQDVALSLGNTSERTACLPSMSPGPIKLYIPEVTEVSGIREVRSTHYNFDFFFLVTRFEWQQAVITRGADGLLGFKFQKSQTPDDPYSIINIDPIFSLDQLYEASVGPTAPAVCPQMNPSSPPFTGRIGSFWPS